MSKQLINGLTNETINLGEKTAAFVVYYKITHSVEDSPYWQDISIHTKLDSVEFWYKGGYDMNGASEHNVLVLTESDFAKLSNGSHTITIETTDESGYKNVLTYSFTKKTSTTNNEEHGYIGSFESGWHTNIVLAEKEIGIYSDVEIKQYMDDNTQAFKTFTYNRSSSHANDEILISVVTSVMNSLSIGYHKLTIVATFGSESRTFNFTFAKSTSKESTPVISGKDGHFGKVRPTSSGIATSLIITNESWNDVIVRQYIDDDLVAFESYIAVLGDKNRVRVPSFRVPNLSLGFHYLRIVATSGSKSATRIYTFDNYKDGPVMGTHGTDHPSLGEKTQPFNISYKVNYLGNNSVIAKEYIDDILINTQTPLVYVSDQSETALNVFSISSEIFYALKPGNHVAKVEVTDGIETTMRFYNFTTFHSQTSTLTISDYDRSIGEKEATFTVPYIITYTGSGTLTVKEYLNNTVIRTLNPTSGTQNVVTITEQRFSGLATGKAHTVKIEATDGTLSATRTFTFTIASSAPVISGVDTNLRGKSAAFSIDYEITNKDGKSITVTEMLDNTTINSYKFSTKTKDGTVNVDDAVFAGLSLGNHVISIKAMDTNGIESIRTYTFQKVDNYLKFNWNEAKETEKQISSLLIIPDWEIPPGANVKVESTNNAFDTEVIWEDITTEVMDSKYYTFKNTINKSLKYGFNLKFYIDKGTSSSQCVIKRFAGLYK